MLRQLAQGGLAYLGRLLRKARMHAELSSSLKEGRGAGSQMPEHSEQRSGTQPVQGAFVLKSAHDRPCTPARYVSREVVSMHK